MAVTVQVAVPALAVLTLISPLGPDPLAVAPAPVQLTLADVALAVFQVNLLLCPVCTLVGLKLAAVTATAVDGFTVRSTVLLT